MSRFTVKDMLIATAMVAVGAGAVAYPFHITSVYRGPFALVLFPFGWFSGGALIGAGLFRLFKRPWIGACVGVMVQMFVLWTLLLPSVH